jgi:hypothetical protein
MIPGELILGRVWELLDSDSRLALLVLCVSPRTTGAGIFDGTESMLAHETGLPLDRVSAAINRLQEAGAVRVLRDGSIRVMDAFRWFAQNPDFVRSTLRVVAEKWPEEMADFVAFNLPILAKFKVPSPQPPHGGTTVAPQSPHGGIRKGKEREGKEREEENGKVDGASKEELVDGAGSGNGSEAFVAGLMPKKAAAFEHARKMAGSGEWELGDVISHLMGAEFTSHQLERAKEFLVAMEKT